MSGEQALNNHSVSDRVDDIEQVAEALRKPMMANGLDSTANQGYHGWRCEHVDRYGPCDCFDELVRDLAVDVAATPQMQALARHAAIGAAVLGLDRETFYSLVLLDDGPLVWVNNVAHLPAHQAANRLQRAIAAALGEDE